MANVKQQLEVPSIPSLGYPPEVYERRHFNENNSALNNFFRKLISVLGALFGPRGGKFMNNPYGAFQSTADQTAAAANTAYAMTLNTVDYANGVSVASNSRITVADAGIWNLQWSGQFQNTDSQLHDVRVWLKINGTVVTGSTGFISIPSKHGSINGHSIAGWNYFLSLNANSYVELIWEADSTAISIQAYPASGNYPSTASVIATMSFVSNLPTI
jgi:hypothetical protein